MARTKKTAVRKQANIPQTNVEVGADHENDFDDFEDDVMGGEDVDSEDDERDKKKRRHEEEEDPNKMPPYMFFDFRKGAEGWPSCVEFVDPKRADELLEKATTAAGIF